MGRQMGRQDAPLGAPLSCPERWVSPKGPSMIDRGRLDMVVTRTLQLDLDALPIRDRAALRLLTRADAAPPHSSLASSTGANEPPRSGCSSSCAQGALEQ
jgi:hypothetical protein